MGVKFSFSNSSASWGQKDLWTATKGRKPVNPFASVLLEMHMQSLNKTSQAVLRETRMWRGTGYKPSRPSQAGAISADCNFATLPRLEAGAGDGPHLSLPRFFLLMASFDAGLKCYQ